MNKYIWLAVLLTGCAYKTNEQKLAALTVQSIQVGDVHVVTKWLPYYGMKDSVDGYYYFDIKFQKQETTKPDKEKTMYLNFAMQQDFILAIGRDSVIPSICQKIENGMAGSYQYTLAFDKRGKDMNKEDLALVYRDKIFGIGMLAFVYKQSDIRKIPKLKSLQAK